MIEDVVALKSVELFSLVFLDGLAGAESFFLVKWRI